MSVRVVYQDIAVGAAEDAAITAAGQTDFSAIALLPFGSGNDRQYASLELNAWLLDGSMSLYDNAPVAFWTRELSGEDCAFAAPPEIDIQFDERYSSLGVSLHFGQYHYASEVEITWYQGETVLDEMTFYPNTSEYFCENTVQAYDRIIIRFIKSNMPHWRVRLDTIIFGIVRSFLRDELRRVTVVEEIDPSARELPENTMDWTLSSRQVIDYIFQRRQPVDAYNGDTLIGAFYITQSSKRSATLYDINCVDAIGVLDEDTFPDGMYTDKNALELAQEICPDFEIVMDDRLKDRTVSGTIIGKTRRQALQQLCFALGAVADTSRMRGIKIFKLSAEDPLTIGEDRIRTGGSVTQDAPVSAVKLTSHTYSATGEGDSVTVNGVTYYDAKTVHTMTNPDITASDTANVVEIADATLISEDNAEEILQLLYNYCRFKATQSLKFRLDGEMVGDPVSTLTPWLSSVTGTLKRMSIVLSGIAVADSEVVGV